MVQTLAQSAASASHSNDRFQVALDAHLNGALDEAVAGYHGVVAEVPAHVDAWANLCIALQALGRAEEAAAAGRRALALRPEMAELYVNLAAALKSLGKLGEARDALQRAIALQPESALAYLNLGNVLRAAGAARMNCRFRRGSARALASQCDVGISMPSGLLAGARPIYRHCPFQSRLGA